MKNADCHTFPNIVNAIVTVTAATIATISMTITVIVEALRRTSAGG
jgi:hypothetical protein